MNSSTDTLPVLSVPPFPSPSLSSSLSPNRIAHAIRHLDPDYIFNMATLTGAQAMATGVLHAGVVAPSEEVEQLVVRAGLVSGDVCFPMMYCPEFLAKELSSVVADMKNSARNRCV